MSGQPKDSIDNRTEAPSGPGPDGLIKVRDLTEAETAEYLRRKAIQDQPNFHEVVAGMAARQSMCLSKSELEKLLEEFNSDEALALIHPGLVAWKKEFLTIQNETILANKLVFFELAKCTPPPQTGLEPKELSGSDLSVRKQQKKQVAKTIASFEKAIEDAEKLILEDSVRGSLQIVNTKRYLDDTAKLGLTIDSPAVLSNAIEVLAADTLVPVIEGMKRELENLRALTVRIDAPAKKRGGAPSQQLAEVAVLLANVMIALGLRPTHYQNGDFSKLFKIWLVYWGVECSVEHALKTAIKTISAAKGSK